MLCNLQSLRDLLISKQTVNKQHFKIAKSLILLCVLLGGKEKIKSINNIIANKNETSFLNSFFKS
jgi:hypothetical protein